VIIPSQAADDRQLRSTFPAFDSTQSPSMPVRYHSSRIALPENGFRGDNRSRYANPEMDSLVERYQVAIPIDERRRLLGQMVHIMTDDVVTIGIFYLIEPAAISNRIKHTSLVRGENAVFTWNAHEWDLE
jgi:ABC-type transport system substrate-binding protein